MNKLTQKELLFCKYYQLTGNYREAAARAGFARPEKNGLKMLSSKRIADYIADMKPKAPVSDEVIQGLRRLAFGSIADAVGLLFADELPDNLDSLDLFSISEIKRPKSGGIEIKFFDRLKALEHLASLTEDSSARNVEPFYRALEKSAQGLFGEDGGDDYGI